MTELKFTDTRRLSHAYIISSASAGAGLAAARDIAAAAVCSGSGARPCGVCRDCRKVFADVHPDVVTLRHPLDDKGREKREYAVNQIRGLVSDACILPNEAEGKAYIIPQAETLNTAGQNAALKLLEEPPKGVVLILCTDNPQMLLTTVRSRCVEISANSPAAAPEEPTLETARSFIQAAATGDKARLYAWCSANEGMDTRTAAAFVDSAFCLTAEMLCRREPDYGLTRAEIMRLNALLSKCAAYLKVNTGVKHIFGLLAVRVVSAGAEERTLN